MCIMPRTMCNAVSSVAFLLALAIPASADDAGPGRISTLTVSTGKTTAALTWTAGGGDCASGNASTYEIRRSGSAITDTNWQSATLAATGTSETNGNSQCHDFASLACNSTYYWVVFAIDASGNRSPLGNVVSVAQKGCGTSSEVLCP